MLSTGFAKLCFVVAAIEGLFKWNSVDGSSIYVGRHEAGTYSEQIPSESALPEGKIYLKCVQAGKSLSSHKWINCFEIK